MVIDTTRAAATDNEPRAQSQRERVAIALLSPRTRDELAQVLDLPLSSVCGRVNELCRDWLVEPIGERRITRAGSQADVMALSEMGLDWAEELLA